MDLVRIFICKDAVEANIIKTKLESENIQCVLMNENTTTLLPHHCLLDYSGVQVFIHKKDLERAKDIIEINTPEDLKDVVCPYCQSTNIKVTFGKHKFWKMIGSFFAALVAIPLKPSNFAFYCRDCKKEFLK